MNTDYTDYTGYSVLVVDDDPSFSQITEQVLGDEGFKVSHFINPIEALEHLKTNNYDLILLDYFMPEMTGEEFVPKLREFNKTVPVVLQTGYADEEKPLVLLNRMDIQGYYDKTKDMEDLVLYVASIFRILEQTKR